MASSIINNNMIDNQYENPKQPSVSAVPSFLQQRYYEQNQGQQHQVHHQILEPSLPVSHLPHQDHQHQQFYTYYSNNNNNNNNNNNTHHHQNQHHNAEQNQNLQHHHHHPPQTVSPFGGDNNNHNTSINHCGSTVTSSSSPQQQQQQHASPHSSFAHSPFNTRQSLDLPNAKFISVYNSTEPLKQTPRYTISPNQQQQQQQGCFNQSDVLNTSTTSTNVAANGKSTSPSIFATNGQVPWSCHSCYVIMRQEAEEQEEEKKRQGHQRASDDDYVEPFFIAFGHKCQRCGARRDTSAIRVFVGQLTHEGNIEIVQKMVEELVILPNNNNNNQNIHNNNVAAQMGKLVLHIEPHTNATTGRGKGCVWVYVYYPHQMFQVVSAFNARTFVTIIPDVNRFGSGGNNHYLHEQQHTPQKDHLFVGFYKFAPQEAESAIQATFEADREHMPRALQFLLYRSCVVAEMPKNLNGSNNTNTNNNCQYNINSDENLFYGITNQQRRPSGFNNNNNNSTSSHPNSSNTTPINTFSNSFHNNNNNNGGAMNESQTLNASAVVGIPQHPMAAIMMKNKSNGNNNTPQQSQQDESCAAVIVPTAPAFTSPPNQVAHMMTPNSNNNNNNGAKFMHTPPSSTSSYFSSRNQSANNSAVSTSLAGTNNGSSNNNNGMAMVMPKFNNIQLGSSAGNNNNNNNHNAGGHAYQWNPYNGQKCVTTTSPVAK